MLLFVLFDPEGEETTTFEPSETMHPMKHHHFSEDLNLQDHNCETPKPRFPPGPISLGIEKYRRQLHLHIPMCFVWMYIGYVMVHRDHVSINASCHTRRQRNKQSIKLTFKRKLQFHILLYMDVYGNESPRDENKLKTIKNNC